MRDSLLKAVVLFLTFGIGVTGALDGRISADIKDSGDKDVFTVFADSYEITVTFNYPKDADFVVTVYGRKHDKLGKFRLAEGRDITLTGGGLFYVEVSTADEGGHWVAVWDDSD